MNDCIHWKEHKFSGCVKGLCPNVSGGNLPCSKYESKNEKNISLEKCQHWIHTGETKTGLQVWISAFVNEGGKYLRIQYKNDDGKNIGEQQQFSFEQISLLKGLVEIWNMEIGYGWEK